MSTDSRDFGAFAYKAMIATGLLAAAVVGVALLVILRDVMVLMFAAVLLATVMTWPADVMSERLKWPRAACLAIVIVAVLALLTFFFWSAGARVASQVQEFNTSLPPAFDSLKQRLMETKWGPTVVEQSGNVVGYLREATTQPAVLTRAQGVVAGTIGVIGNIAIVVVLAVFLALTPKLYVHGVVKLFPLPARKRAHEVLCKTGASLRWWSLGQFASMTVVGTLVAIGLASLGVPMAITLGILAGLLNFIPNFGPIIAALPALVLAIAPHDGNPNLDIKLGAYVAILYIVVQVLEGNVITPFIQKRAVDLPAALIILAQLVLVILVGFIGLVVATPLLVAVLVIIKMVYVQSILGDKSEKLDIDKKT